MLIRVLSASFISGEDIVTQSGWLFGNSDDGVDFDDGIYQTYTSKTTSGAIGNSGSWTTTTELTITYTDGNQSSRVFKETTTATDKSTGATTTSTREFDTDENGDMTETDSKTTYSGTTETTNTQTFYPDGSQTVTDDTESPGHSDITQTATEYLRGQFDLR